ncbi:MAG: DUF1127 domain-containing protein [Hyphomicrobiaceae bacterium]
MSQAARQTTTIASAAKLVGLLGDGTASFLAKVQERRRLARDRRLMGELSDAQLADAGLERCHANRPVLVVEPGLMSNLMSMR